MIRHTINIGPYQYVADLYLNNELQNNDVLKSFVIIRNFDLINDLICDKEIYIIEKTLYDEFLLSESYESDNIIFPITSKNVISFSNNYKAFNSNISKDNYSTIYDIKQNADDIQHNNIHIASIKCDLIKLYHPHIKPNLNAIISIENHINNIHFYYICKKYSNFHISSDGEFRLNNNIYSEYINIYFPSLKELFKNDDLFYDETLNIIELLDNKENIINKIIYDNNIQYAPFNLFTKKYKINTKIDDGLQYFIKSYIDNNDNIYVNYPITINIYPYTCLDKEENDTNVSLFIFDDNLTIGSDTFLFNSKFRLQSRLGFADNKISILNTFDYPLSNDLSFYESYKYFYNVTDEEYEQFNNIQHGNLTEEINMINNISTLSDYDKRLLENAEHMKFDQISNPLNKYKEWRIKWLKEEFKEEKQTDELFIGYKIVIATDIKFKNIILIKTINQQLKDVENEFAFNLTDIFNSWDEKPEILIAKVEFVDNYLGTIINGNTVTITKEFFKYMINDTNNHIFRLQDLTNKNNIIKDMKVYNANTDQVNFINTINCKIIKEKDSSINTNINKESARIIYKPVFYRVQELNNIFVESNNNTQNIGINLVNYMSKVEAFKLVIDNHEYIEYGRNSIYVIFQINSSDLVNTSGRYKIMNNDNEYISSGNWSLI